MECRKDEISKERLEDKGQLEAKTRNPLGRPNGTTKEVLQAWYAVNRGIKSSEGSTKEGRK